jgi:hypothetical protein
MGPDPPSEGVSRNPPKRPKISEYPAILSGYTEVSEAAA